MDKRTVVGFYEMIWSTPGDADGPDPRLELHETVVEGDLHSGRFTMSGTHRGDFPGVPATGRSSSLPGITIMRFRASRVVERWSSADFLGLMVQLGAVPAPPG